MVIIGENERDLRNLFYGKNLRTVRPVIQMKFGLILSLGCRREKKRRRNFMTLSAVQMNVCGRRVCILRIKFFSAKVRIKKDNSCLEFPDGILSG
jgi:hypothetical protein